MIKLLACFFMVIDHVGIIFFPDNFVLRLIGRVSFPLFAYCIVRGIKHTHDIKKYANRVLLVGVISQIPYMIMMNEVKLNICFLWYAFIMLVYGYKRLQSPFKRALLIFCIVVPIVIIPMDYGLYGLVYIALVFSLSFQSNDLKIYGAWAILHIFYLLIRQDSGVMQLFTLPSIAIIDICNRYGFENRPIKGFFIQWFYPLHIIILLTLYVLYATM